LKLLAVLNDKTFTGIREISDEEFQNIQKYIQTLLMFQKDYERLAIAAKSLKSYEDTITSFLRNDISYVELKNAILERLLNFVATFRSVLDHWETYLKRTYGGKDSGEVKEFKLATGKEYDQYFSYRFIYELRNYTLHCDMPISRVSAKLHPDDSKEIEVILNRDKLLETYDWPKKVKLETMPEEFEIHNHMTQAFECLARIHQVCFNTGDTGKVYGAALEIYKIKVDNKDKVGELAFVFFEGSHLNTPTSIQRIPIYI
jgi:hypothetical protein